MSAENTKKKKKGGFGFALVIILCLAVCGVAGYKLITTLLEYKQGEDEYEALQAYTVVRESEPQEKEEEADIWYDCPIDVDFDALRAINEDIVGWIYIGSLDISYPIVHGKDNDYYLHRTFERTYNFAGSIFVEAKNRGDFSDPNTIIYGHNMKNGSMFGTLKHLTTKEEKLQDPHFWILTPQSNYYYEMFSIRQTAVDSDVYTLFSGPDRQIVDYAQKMASESAHPLPEQKFEETSKIATLSTCTGNSATRYVVQGNRIWSSAEHTRPAEQEDAGSAEEGGEG